MRLTIPPALLALYVRRRPLELLNRRRVLVQYFQYLHIVLLVSLGILFDRMLHMRGFSPFAYLLEYAHGWSLPYCLFDFHVTSVPLTDPSR